MDQMGHSTAAENELYMVAESEDYERRERAVRALQEKIIGKPVAGVQ
jgi:hypothetical protein